MERISIGMGDRVGFKSFRYYERLGSGAFGEVYLVEKIDSKQLYAMKVMRKEKFIS
jgi:serine/threonine protein kinase